MLEHLDHTSIAIISATTSRAYQPLSVDGDGSHATAAMSICQNTYLFFMSLIWIVFQGLVDAPW